MSDALLGIGRIRLMRFKELQQEFRSLPSERDQPDRGQLNRFGAHADLSPRYLSHIVNGRKAIGAQTARSLEKAFGKPQFWMDTEAPVPTNDYERVILALATQAAKIDLLATHKALLAIVDRGSAAR
jgi:plasmid maintenance system antidote protein VapI